MRLGDNVRDRRYQALPSAPVGFVSLAMGRDGCTPYILADHIRSAIPRQTHIERRSDMERGQCRPCRQATAKAFDHGLRVLQTAEYLHRYQTARRLLLGQIHGTACAMTNDVHEGVIDAAPGLE